MMQPMDTDPEAPHHATGDRVAFVEDYYKFKAGSAGVVTYVGISVINEPLYRILMDTGVETWSWGRSIVAHG
jgi:hypothetical protein